MHYVYILKSTKDPSRYYVGLTIDLDRRLEQYNDPNEPTWTKRFMPWELGAYLVFEEESKARNFEVYLKSHSGKAFLKKHLI